MSVSVVSSPVPAVLERRQVSNSFASYAFLTSSLAMILAISRAYNMSDVSLPIRLIFWHLIVGLAVAQTVGVELGLRRAMPEWKWNSGVAIFGAVGVNIALVTVEVHMLKHTPLCPKAIDPLIDLAVFLSPLVIVISLVTLALPRLALGPWGNADLRSAVPEESTVVPKAVSISDSGPGDAWPAGPISRIVAHDHYLEVITQKGRHFTRARMKDAVERMGDTEGMQVHRSHWVSRHEVAQVRRKGRDYRLELQDGSEIPVGRSRIQSLREAGWF